MTNNPPPYTKNDEMTTARAAALMAIYTSKPQDFTVPSRSSQTNPVSVLCRLMSEEVKDIDTIAAFNDFVLSRLADCEPLQQSKLLILSTDCTTRVAALETEGYCSLATVVNSEPIDISHAAESGHVETHEQEYAA